MRHNHPTTFLAQCMKEVHQDVELEPPLQPLNGETFRHLTANTEPDARADIRVRGFWTNSRNAFFDTRVFYPHARSYQSRSLPSLYKRFESEKKREYGERINTVEHGSFTPLVFSACGGMGHEATVVVRKLGFCPGIEATRNLLPRDQLVALPPIVLSRTIRHPMCARLSVYQMQESIEPGTSGPGLRRGPLRPVLTPNHCIICILLVV